MVLEADSSKVVNSLVEHMDEDTWHPLRSSGRTLNVVIQLPLSLGGDTWRMKELINIWWPHLTFRIDLVTTLVDSAVCAESDRRWWGLLNPCDHCAQGLEILLPFVHGHQNTSILTPVGCTVITDVNLFKIPTKYIIPLIFILLYFLRSPKPQSRLNFI